MKRVVVALMGVLLAVFSMARVASAGPVILDGTDANEKGSTNGTVNLGGWRYMQDALEHLSRVVYPGVAKVVVDLGTSTDATCSQPDARAAIDSAFTLSSLPGRGWSLMHVDGSVAITAWLRNLSTANTGILYIPTFNNLCGDLWQDEINAINANPTAIANFVNGPGDPTKGGALFAMGERDWTTPVTSSATPLPLNPSFGPSTGAFLWLQSISGIHNVVSHVNGEDLPITLTVLGATTFPSVTNGELFADNVFKGNFGDLSALGTGVDSNGVTQAAILGGGAGTHFSGPLGNLIATKTGSLFIDADKNGVISPGDTLLYSVNITNTGQVSFTGVVFYDILDPNTHLVVGSVEASAGTVTSGNNPGDIQVGVDIGTIPGGGSVGIMYKARIANPLPTNVHTVTNQGTVSTTVGIITTNDPITPGPTVITVTNTTSLELTGVSDAPQCVLPGSSYHITWTVANVGGLAFPGGLIDTLVTGSGSGPLTTSIPAIPTGTSASVMETIAVSEPVAYGGETVTVTGSIFSSTAVLASHICAPDFRSSVAHVTSRLVAFGEAFTYTWQISNTGDAAALSTTAVLTLPDITYFSFMDNLTSTTGLVTFDPLDHTVRWTGNLAEGESVKIGFNALADFGLPHVLLDTPFEVNHPYRPPFIGAVTYDYPYKLFFMLILKDSSPSQ